jgi:hypothetical protein
MELFLANPRTREERATLLVQKDESTLYVSAVSQVANARLQHLLPKLVSGTPLKGRFASKRELNIVTEVSVHPELPRCRSASGAHVLEYAARRFSLRLAFRAAPNFIDHVFNFHFDPQTR